MGVPLDPEIKALPIGEAELLRDGHDVALVAIGTLAHSALEAAERLRAEDGLSVAVLNARFARPLDRERILGVADQCGAVVTVEEHVGAGGFGSAVLELLSEEALRIPTRVLAVQGDLVEHGETRDTVGLAIDDMMQAARALVAERRTGSA